METAFAALLPYFRHGTGMTSYSIAYIDKRKKTGDAGNRRDEDLGKRKRGERGNTLNRKKWILLLLLCCCIFVLPGYGQAWQVTERLSVPLVMVIDPGHGGLDGGAVASDGTMEKDINLAIASALAREAEKYGVKTVLTRETGDGLYSEANASGKWSKIEDMKERKRIIEETDPDLTISIHLNSFLQDTDVYGAQVFYPQDAQGDVLEENIDLAQTMQEALIAGIDDGSNRIILPKDGIYLFENADRLMLMVECGFLSNPADLENLKDEQYQQKLAVCMMNAVAEKFSLQKKTTAEKELVDSRTE